MRRKGGEWIDVQWATGESVGVEGGARREQKAYRRSDSELEESTPENTVAPAGVHKSERVRPVGEISRKSGKENRTDV
jgi:hypothetical protein